MLMKLVAGITMLHIVLIIYNGVINICFLIINVFQDYFSDCTETIIKENYVVVYEVIFFFLFALRSQKLRTECIK